MSEEIEISKHLSIREAGLDEYWLQDQIYENPTCLGLGELEGLSKERRQTTGGRLDILLINPEDDSMYEVEVMLGDTDESHIIRTIEYWDNEKRRWPQRQHTAVIVAERITRRFFNVIHLLSNSIPIVAVQATLLQSHGKKTLNFSKILDTYVEVDDGRSVEKESHDEAHWGAKAPWTLDTAKYLLSGTGEIFKEASLNLVKQYIAINVAGANCMWLHKRSNNKSLLGFRMEETLQEEVAGILDAKNISYIRNPRGFRITVDREMVAENIETFKSVADFIKRSMGAVD